ncbi:glutaredoxin family protein [Pseudonocardia sp. GCM10023141]|uniref:glutaredoxin family protein n=1 Tax=Pseudonocardia sp. GCM10023141 TaxID=3252653 RepID=UPI003A97CC5F
MVEVTVLTQPDCGFCEIAQAVLARVAQDYPLAVRWIELGSEDGRDLAMRHGVLFAPGVLLDGEMFSYGRLSERRLRRHLARRSVSADPVGGDQGAHRR